MGWLTAFLIIAGGCDDLRPEADDAVDNTPGDDNGGGDEQPGVVTQEQVDRILGAWGETPRDVAHKTMTKYGLPQEATPSQLTWFNNAPWKRTVLSRDEVEHRFPAPHTDLLEQVIDYRAAPESYGLLAQYDGSVILERTKGEMSARCDLEEANFLALNLAHEVALGQRTPQEARQFYSDTIAAFKAGRSSPYVEGLMFQGQTLRPTADPDVPVPAMPIVIEPR
jgi:hypothetical protein